MSSELGEPRSSNLTFAVCQTPGSNPLDRLRRVREPVSRSKSGVQGKVADVVNGRSRHAESQNELKAFQILAATAHADSWQEQPFTLEYRHEGEKHRYTPDILVIWGSRHDVVEVKDDQEAALPENRVRFAFISELLAEHGYHFRLWRKSEICAEPRLTNSNLVLRYRRAVVPPPDRERVRGALSATSELPLRTLCEHAGTAIPTVLRLVLDGALHIDWWAPLGMEAKVSIAPVGRQVWPCWPSEISGRRCGEDKCH